MKLIDIYNYLDEISPFELQESWDNSGLQVGDFDKEITKIYVSLDLDEKQIDSFEDNSLVITHHPLIFGSLKKLDFNTYPANFIKKLIKKDISLISMHTNFDKTHLNEYVACEILGFEIEKKEDFLIYIKKEDSFENILKYVSNKLKLKNPKVVKSHEKISSIALCTGSGASLLKDLKVDLFLTGDIKYHDAMLAKALNISMIDIEHFASEVFFSEILEKNLKNLGLEVIISQSVNPFDYE